MSTQEHDYCPISAATKIVGDFWNILIVRELMKNPVMRFNELEAAITDVTSSTLSSRLKILVKEDIILRNQHESIPPKVEYTLTEKGKALAGLVTAVEKFGNKYY